MGKRRREVATLLYFQAVDRPSDPAAVKALTILGLKPELMKTAYHDDEESDSEKTNREKGLSKIKGGVKGARQEIHDIDITVPRLKKAIKAGHADPKTIANFKKEVAKLEKERATQEKRIDKLKEKRQWKKLTKNDRNSIHQIESKLGSS